MTTDTVTCSIHNPTESPRVIHDAEKRSVMIRPGQTRDNVVVIAPEFERLRASAQKMGRENELVLTSTNNSPPPDQSINKSKK